ncbi:DUF4157 domain-containing protein [Rheinheimera sp.]|uniref:eCIS core domain-containing protein n=1 Tax=Rheinheimera sp. TaxID=1869214 RepID=UPI0027353CEC|nr:DUF4157 domain-containing protein [Rheinheimera sp.]MDP2715136.1 DUF4157 domain-containing protein [Rheinheimera sp.]
MKFAQGRTRESQRHTQQVQAGVASSALQQSLLQQQQAQQLSAIKHSPQQLLQRKLLQGAVSQQMSVEEEPLQGKFAVVQQAALEEEEPLQGKFAVVQQAALEEEEPLQGKFAVVQQAALDEEEPMQGKFEPAAVTQRQAEASSNNTGMPDQLKSGIESLSGYAMDDVKVHYNSAKPAQMQAHAYAQGSDIHIAPGQEQHLPHEAWHVVQQKQGRVKATTQLKGEAINDDPGLEHEADVMGAKALSSAAKSATMPQLKAILIQRAPIAQMAWIPIINNAARRHYNDGWGDLYNITSDGDLEDEVEQNGPEEDGQQSIDLGSYAHADEHLVRPCYVLFRNWQGDQGDDMSTIYHCGPGNG